MGRAWKKVPLKVSMHIRVLSQDYNWKVADIKKKYPDIPTRTISYHAKLNTDDETVDRRHSNPGRPRILQERDIRRLGTKVKSLRKFDDPNFSAVKLRNVCGLPPCSMQTIHRALKKDLNIHFLNTRQKGILSDNDRKLRVDFCRECMRRVGDKLWLEGISFYYDLRCCCTKIKNLEGKIRRIEDNEEGKKRREQREEGFVICRNSVR